MDSLADEGVVATNDDAAICKYQAVSKGYYNDPFIDLFLSAKIKTSAPRKAPEINRGYYARSTSVAFIVEKFIESYPNAQVINLGAGYDTLFWRLNSNGFISSDESDDTTETPRRCVTYVEVDMSSVVVHKMMSIRRNTPLNRALSSISYRGEGLYSKNYHLLSYDLRQVDKTPLKNKFINECRLDTTKPTLCLAECVLIYMPSQDSSSLISWLNELFSKNLSIVNYEQCNMSDRFGEIMMANMNARNCDLMGVKACQSLSSQRERMESNGLGFVKGWTLLEILKQCLLPASIERVFSIEFLDEKELLEQLLEHYCIVLGSNKPLNWIPENEFWLSKSTP